MSKILLITLILAGLILAGGYAWAKQNGYCSGERFAERVVERVSDKLDLSEEQQVKLNDFAHLLRQRRSGDDKPRIGARLTDLLSAPALDRDRVLQLLDERHAAMAERKGELVDSFADFSDSLNPNQRAQLVELISNRFEHRWGSPRWAN